jgi:hypothetical protein
MKPTLYAIEHWNGRAWCAYLIGLTQAQAKRHAAGLTMFPVRIVVDSI